MTERQHKPQESLIRDEHRLSAVSIFAGHIAHEFNNLLTPLVAYPPIIRDVLPAGAQERELLNVIEKTGKDMATITRQLMAFSSRTSLPRYVVDINELVAKVVSRVQTLPEAAKITVTFLPAGDVVPVAGWNERIQDAVESLCVNAIEAVSEGGMVTVRTESARMADGVMSSGMPILAGNYAVVIVSDTGAGIPDNIRDRIFEPFVTTKKGTARRRAGLGLPIAYRTAVDHGGAVDFDCGAGKEETTFRLYLSSCEPVAPATDIQGDDASTVSGANVTSPRDRGRMLIVDDEKIILKLFNMILSSALPGVRIDAVSNGAEAVDAFGSGHHGIIVMDLHMPVMDGQVAFGRIEKLCGDLKWEMPPVIFCTGFAPPDTVTSIVSQNSMHCLLSKPVSGHTLVEAVKSRLLG